jgi:heptaprenylglyceryl phosphate synthase
MDRLRSSRPGLLHVIDPFKVPLDQAIIKVQALEEFGFPAVLLASTDYENFTDHMSSYARTLRDVTTLPLVLHFPPRKGCGYPLVKDVDAAIFPFLFGSTDAYFVWESLLETTALMNNDHHDGHAWPSFIYSAALTFGDDAVSQRVMDVYPVGCDRVSLGQLAALVNILKLDMVYLYSRFEKVPSRTIEFLSENIPNDTVLIASGGIRDHKRIDEYLSAGADYVVFCGALECNNWRCVLERIVATA